MTPSSDDQEAETRRRIAVALSRVTLTPPSTTRDFHGAVIDRLTVVAFSHTLKKGNSNRHYWVVRCQCGEHELRSHKSLGREVRGEYMCEKCAHRENLKSTNKPPIVATHKPLKGVPPAPGPAKRSAAPTRLALSHGAEWPPKLDSKLENL